MESKKIEIERWPVDKLKPYEMNSKRHKVAWIAKSIEQFDFDQPIVIDSDGNIIKGHGRLEAAKMLGYETVPVIIRDDLTEDQIKLSRIADNRAAHGAGFDEEKLSFELEALKLKFDQKILNKLGFNEAFLRKIGQDSFGFDFEEMDGDQTNYSTESCQTKTALSIVIDASTNEIWEKFKQEHKKKTDTSAFIELLKAVE